MSTLQINSAEVAEIEKHKYFLSEKAGHDVGWEAAEQDWLAHHAEGFRSSNRDEDEPEAGSGIRVYLKRLFIKR